QERCREDTGTSGGQQGFERSVQVHVIPLYLVWFSGLRFLLCCAGRQAESIVSLMSLPISWTASQEPRLRQTAAAVVAPEFAPEPGTRPIRAAHAGPAPRSAPLTPSWTATARCACCARPPPVPMAANCCWSAAVPKSCPLTMAAS